MMYRVFYKVRFCNFTLAMVGIAFFSMVYSTTSEAKKFTVSCRVFGYDINSKEYRTILKNSHTFNMKTDLYLPPEPVVNSEGEEACFPTARLSPWYASSPARKALRMQFSALRCHPDREPYFSVKLEIKGLKILSQLSPSAPKSFMTFNEDKIDDSAQPTPGKGLTLDANGNIYNGVDRPVALQEGTFQFIYHRCELREELGS